MKVTARPSFDQLVESLDRAHHTLCGASADMLETISYLDANEHWGDDETSLSCFLAARYGVSSGTAWGWVRVARALRDLPAIAEAHAAGHISWDQLRPLTRFATAETDERLALEAPGMRLGRLWRECWRHERALKQREMKSDRQARSLQMGWDEEKRNLHVEADLPGEQGAAFEAAVTGRAEQIVVEDGVLDPKGARLADALTELVTAAGEAAQPATLVVHADASVLVGEGAAEAHLAETESGAQLSDDAVRRLACDARVEWVLERAGRTVGIGRQSRLIPGWMTRQLRFRDPECRFDGCSRRMNLDHPSHLAVGSGRPYGHGQPGEAVRDASQVRSRGRVVDRRPPGRKADVPSPSQATKSAAGVVRGPGGVVPLAATDRSPSPGSACGGQ